MLYVLVSDGIVVQKQPYPEPGFIEASEDVVCGFLYDESAQLFSPPPELEPDPSQIIEDFRLAIQDHVDTQARSRRYDSGNSLATYATSTIPQWASEATAFVAWRDAVWAYAYAEMDKVLGGLREQPTVQEFLDELPTIAWPGGDE